MIITLTPNANPKAVRQILTHHGLWVAQIARDDLADETHFVIADHSAYVHPSVLTNIPGIRSVSVPQTDHPRIDKQGPCVDVRGVTIGGGLPVFMCGPCSVDSPDTIHRIAAHVASLGVQFLRGGAYKPRTSPYSFQGHGPEALSWLFDAARAHNLRIVTEVLAEADVPVVAERADLLQIGSRNMQNFALLKAVGAAHRPVLLKRSMSATVEEWLLAGEYLLVHGAAGVVLCERGIRGFDNPTRNLLDLGSVALLAHVHRLPVIVDPSHATGRRDLILPLGRAALAAGAAGVMIETHPEPSCALSDGPQAVPLEALGTTLDSLKKGLA